MMKTTIAALLLALFTALPLATSPADAQSTITGPASVIDGDTIEIHGIRIGLHGIDAPESGQSCVGAGKQTRCGQQAARALQNKIGGSPVSCALGDRDMYDRVLAVCRNAGGENLNGWMVARGWALAHREYSAEYVGQEEQAASAKLGIWQGDFVAPWDWRQGKRLLSGTPAPLVKPTAAPRVRQPARRQPASCAIKGDIGTRGGQRIYHVPGERDYGQIRIDTSKGERWFCSEAEAQSAGWRRSRR